MREPTEQPANDDPLYVGPPPPKPDPPVVVQNTHVLHLLLTLITFGFWLIMWFVSAAIVENTNRREQRRYERELAEWPAKYDEWQRRYHAVYGAIPPPQI